MQEPARRSNAYELFIFILIRTGIGIIGALASIFATVLVTSAQGEDVTEPRGLGRCSRSALLP